MIIRNPATYSVEFLRPNTFNYIVPEEIVSLLSNFYRFSVFCHVRRGSIYLMKTKSLDYLDLDNSRWTARNVLC